MNNELVKPSEAKYLEYIIPCGVFIYHNRMSNVHMINPFLLREKGYTEELFAKYFDLLCVNLVTGGLALSSIAFGLETLLK